MKKKTNNTKTHFEQLIEKDRWHGANDLGLEVIEHSSTYWLQFNKINPCWLRKSAKQFIYQEALTKTYSTCVVYLKTLISFGNFIIGINPRIQSNDINRKLMVDYIHELCAVRKLKPNTVTSHLSKLRSFFQKNDVIGRVFY